MSVQNNRMSIKAGAALLAATLLAGLTGCEQQATVALPKPNFQPPLVVPFKPLPPAQNLAQLPPTVNGVPRDWVPKVKPNQWSWIIIHHTATPAGALARIDAAHRAKGWDCAGYDFIIGNGTESRDGQVEVGPRWPIQMVGAHTKSDDNRFNKWGVGIVLVGNFEETKPSKKQIESISKLVAYLMRTYRIPADHVIAHRDTKSTLCPGKYTNVAQIRQMASQILVDAGEPLPEATNLAIAPGEEMLHDAGPENQPPATSDGL